MSFMNFSSANSFNNLNNFTNFNTLNKFNLNQKKKNSKDLLIFENINSINTNNPDYKSLLNDHYKLFSSYSLTPFNNNNTSYLLKTNQNQLLQIQNIEDPDDLINIFSSFSINNNSSSNKSNQNNGFNQNYTVNGNLSSLNHIKTILNSYTNYLFDHKRTFDEFFATLRKDKSILLEFLGIDNFAEFYNIFDRSNNIRSQQNDFYDFVFENLNNKELYQLYLLFKKKLVNLFLILSILKILPIFQLSSNKILNNINQDDLILPISKISNFNIWDNSTFKNNQSVVNDLIPDCFLNLIKLPFEKFNIINSPYIYNCLVHYLAFPEDFPFDKDQDQDQNQNLCSEFVGNEENLNLIWFDRLSKLKLNKLIYLNVFKKIDPFYQFDNKPSKKRFQKEKLIYSENSNVNNINDEIESAIKEKIFLNDYHKQTFENYLINNLTYHTVNNVFDLLDVFTFFYDLSIEDYSLNQNFSFELLQVLLKFFNLKLIDYYSNQPALKKQFYENSIHLNFVKMLRYKSFFLNLNNYNFNFNEFKGEILYLERNFSINYNTNDDFLNKIDKFNKFFNQSGNENHHDNHNNQLVYSNECYNYLLWNGFNENDIMATNFFRYFSYIGLSRD
ncbi:uncharacterized protein ASCRUDRAFT_10540 [Ascoidea rubescens DSM 1968]|uniref:Uncharacterized protein n=1 Tax=Ascoidea rubescens DSM 1968 TaxID=1344418 RepID=A0A1D2V8P1_9ASCO|nr:hypothetical protein ASCRUDRAFT_10540 [Ascoidea rubescens DSM 1968]ODV58071.1 hypothetical protein ASCRUDRAFT_10540 [Ascoidea rubescens DSM 1968]